MPRFPWIVMFVLAVAATLGHAADGEGRRDAARKDLERLQGTWNVVSTERDGMALDPEEFRGWNALYDGDSLTLRVGDQVRRRGIVTLDPARTPKAINTWDLDGPYQDQTVPGIYELEGDRLKLCFARPGEARPTEFTTKAGTGFVFVVYERQKPRK